MNYRDKLKQASFKGVPFEVDGAVSESGRRGVLHEYPNRDVPYFEDLGKKADTYSFEAFIVGDDYIERRDNLRKACTGDGSGTLVHPSLGRIDCYCTAISISERASEMRIARFSLSFTVSGKPSLPDSLPDYTEQVESAADGLIEAATADYIKNFSVQGSPSSIVESVAGVAGDIIDKAAGAIEAVSGAIDEIHDKQEAILDTIDRLTGVADDLAAAKAGIYNVLRFPNVLSARISAALAIIGDLLSPNDALARLRKIAEINAEQTPLGIHSAKLAVEAELKKRIAHLTQLISLAEQAKIIASIGIVNPETAKEILSDYVAAVELHLLEDMLSEENVLSALRELEAATVNAVYASVKKLPETKEITLSQTLPSLVLAYNLYADIDRASEITGRNAIRAPGFIPAGVTLTVLAK
jgi:prophage DNA circulation protein